MPIQLSGSLVITGSLTATSQIVAQTLNVQTVSSSVVYSSGSNIFGNQLSNTQQFTGSVTITGSGAINGDAITTNTANQTLTNKIISGANNTLSNIGNSSLTNSSVTVTAGTGLSGGGAVSLGGSITLSNAGVTSNVAGTGISVSGATGAVTITNTGVTSATAGTGISLSAGTGGITITNSAPDQTVTLTNGGNITITGTYPSFTLTNGVTNNNQLTNGAGYITGITSGMVTTALGYTPVPNTRTLTINGTAYDLSADRSWTIASGVTSVNAGTGISVNQTTGAVTVTNAGVTSVTAGSGISVSASTGGVTIANTITNNNQLTNGAGYITGITSGNVTTALGYTPLPYGNWSGNTGLNDYKLYLRTNGDNNHYLWNAADDWEELNAYEGTGFRITSVGGTVGVLYVYGSSNGGYTYSPYSFRAPIFYDSNDTGYYIDPNSTGTSIYVAGNIYGSGAVSRIQAGSPSSDDILYDSSRSALVARGNYPHVELFAVVSNGNHGGTLRYTGYDNGSSGAYKSWNIGTAGSDLYFLDIGYGGTSNSNPHAGIAGLGASYGYPGAFTMMRFHNNGNVGIGNFGTYGSLGTNTPSYKLDVRGTGYASDDFRSPIFYDSNDTGYYINPNSTSNVYRLNVENYLYASNGAGRIYLGGNLHIDSLSGNAIYMNYYSNLDIRLYGTTYFNGYSVSGIYTGTANESFRAPIFYDSNDTTYYIDPANGGFNLQGGTSNRVKFSTNDSGFLVVNAEGNGVSDVRLGAAWGRPGVYGSSYLSLGTSGTYIEFVTSNVQRGYIDSSSNLFAFGSMRSPIFYDQDDTGYYLNPNSTSRLITTITNTSYFGTDTAKGYAQGYGTYSTSLHKIAYMSFDWNADYNTYSNHGIASTDQNGSFSDNISINSFNDITLRLDANGNNGVSYLRLMNDTTGNSQFGYWGWNGGNYEFFTSGIAYADASMRSPIFYDYNNTGYYLDPNGYSNLGTSGLVLEVTKTGTGPNSRAVQFANNQGDNSWGIVAEFRVNGSPGTDRPSILFSNGFDSKTWSCGYGYADSDYFRINHDHGHRNGGWGTTDWYVDRSGNSYSTTSDRAPIFYDSNDTGYYCDPNSTSRLYTIQLQNSISFPTSNGASTSRGSNYYGIYQEAGGWSYPYPDLCIGFHTGISFGANASYQGMRFFNDADLGTQVMSINNGFDALGSNNVYVNNSLQAGSSLRAPIFYDSDNTGYYGEFAGTSRMTRINLDYLFSYDWVYAQGDIIAYYSDERLKTKIGSIENALDKISQLNGFYYVNNDLAKSFGYKEEKLQIGLSAQEVQKVLPEIVALAPFDTEFDENNNPIGSKSGENYLTVDYSKLVPLLIEAIKDQQTSINNQQAQINELKARLGIL